MAKYLDVDFNSATLYEYSKESKEGFKEHTSSKGNKSFRKLYNKGVTGELLNVSLRTRDIGDLLQIALRNSDDEVVVLKFNLFDNQGNIEQDFAENIIRFLGNMEKGTVYKIQPYLLKADVQKKYDTETAGRTVRDKYYDNRGVSIKLEDGTRVEASLRYKGDGDNIIPELVWRPHPTKEGKQKPSAASLEARTDFLIEKLKEATEGHLQYEDTTSDSSESSESQQENTNSDVQGQAPVEAPKNPVLEEEYDDLPF